MTISHSASSSATEQQPRNPTENSPISHSLKFVVSNLKTLVPHQLSPDNYPIWRHQILKLLRANDFEQFLAPPTHSGNVSDPDIDSVIKNWKITDENLQAAVCSTISPAVLPYIIHLDTTHEILQALESQFQATSRSKVIQLRNELHHVLMKNLSMTQYLTEIKKLVDQIASAGSSIDSKDIILHILNGALLAFTLIRYSNLLCTLTGVAVVGTANIRLKHHSLFLALDSSSRSLSAKFASRKGIRPMYAGIG
ncbi:uncharacterized protein LOC110114560 [Dendrobium catenatum]|uniref:uncharacterized protein LOC110114560 n=1 Tax=Dendrobium catenatum TaxID=906689 RepID=UPI0009F68090|nr:uncharacterized protein LOC110114560 [Dendrobium catenatum]